MNCESLWTYENNQIRIYSVFTCQIKCTKLKLRQCSDKNSLLDLKRCFHFRGINLNDRRDNHFENDYLRSCCKLSQLRGLNDRKGQRSRSPPTFDKYVQLSLPLIGGHDRVAGSQRRIACRCGFHNSPHTIRDNENRKGSFCSLNLGFQAFHANNIEMQSVCFVGPSIPQLPVHNDTY